MIQSNSNMTFKYRIWLRLTVHTYDV